jgi:D-3-phosphoglycerate dehydrogenase
VAFGMNVVVWSMFFSQQDAKALGCEYAGEDPNTLPDLARRCDAVTIHLPADGATKKLFGREFFEAMKPGTYFINTSRGSLVDEAALRDAVATRGIRAGLDVYEGVPAESQAKWTCEIARLPGVFTTHHVGASTDQAQNAVAAEVVRIVKLYKESGKIENSVNG